MRLYGACVIFAVIYNRSEAVSFTLKYEWEGIMNADQVAIVQETFEKVRPISETAADLFYKRLFELNPSFKSLFKGDMKKQGRMLMQMIDFAVKGIDEPDTILPTIRDLGKRHVGYGVKEEYYDTVGEALLWTLEQGLGEVLPLKLRMPRLKHTNFWQVL